MHLIVSTVARSVALTACILDRIAIVLELVQVLAPVIRSTAEIPLVGRRVTASAIYLGGLMTVNVG